MKKLSLILILMTVVLGPVVVPHVAHAVSIVPCGDARGPDGMPIQCNFSDLIRLMQNVINAMFIISIPLATVAFVTIGIRLLFAQGDTSKITQSKKMAMM